MKPFLLLFFQFFICLSVVDTRAQGQCYEVLVGEGKGHLSQHNYRLATNKFFAARTCLNLPRDKEREIDSLINRTQELWIIALQAEKNKAIREKERAEAQARHTLANELAYKAAIALEERNNITAFLLGEFVHRYIEPGNHNAIRVISDAFYRNGMVGLLSDPPEQDLKGHALSVSSVAISPDNQYVLTGSPDSTARLWEVKTLQEVRSFRCSSPVSAVAFSPDQRFVLLGCSDNRAKLFAMDSGQERAFNHGGGAILAVAFSPDGKYVLTGGSDKKAILWETETGKAIRVFEGHLDDISSVAISPDSKFVVTGSFDETARLWSLSNGDVIRSFHGHAASVFAVAISPDGKLLLTGSENGWAKLWDIKTGKEIQSFRGHQGAVSAVAFSPDGQYVLTGSFDHTARLWEIKTGREIRFFPGSNGPVFAVTISSDGRFAVTGGKDNSAKIWNLKADELIAEMRCHYQVRPLTSVDIQAYRLQEALDSTNAWEALFQTADPEQLLAFGQYLQGQAQYNFNRAWFQDYYTKAVKCFARAMGGGAADSLAEEHLHDVYTDWSAKLVYNGLNSEALSKAQLALKLQPGGEASNYQAGVAYFALGDFEKGLRHLLPIRVNGGNLIGRINDWQNNPGFVGNRAWQSCAERLLRLIGPEYREGIAPGIAEQLNLTPLQHNGLSYNGLLRQLPPSLKEMLARIREQDYTEQLKQAGRELIGMISVEENDTTKYSLQKRLAEFHDTLIVLEGSAYQEEAARSYGNLAWYSCLVGKYEEAVSSARKGLALDTTQTWIYTNLALGYLLNGEEETAARLYKEWKNEDWRTSKGDGDYRFFKEVFIADIKEMQERKILSGETPRIIGLIQSLEQ